jgi:hypothetical protein
MKFSIPLLIFSVLIFSCRNNPQSKSEPAADQTHQSSKEIYDLYVSFFSRASGIDYTAFEKFEAFLNEFSPKVQAEEIRWGREGEVDYCINFKNLTKAQKQKFLSEARKITEGSDRVHFKENAPCVYKR